MTTAHFAEIDYLAADRLMPKKESASVSPNLLGEGKRQEFRDSTITAFLQSRQAMQLTGVPSFLSSLDYAELIAQRQQTTKTNDFSVIVDAFEKATGKTILRPRVEESGDIVMEVETPGGIRHLLDQLSSGEQEVLGLMYYVRRLGAQGGVLLLDEPELHLHPALQTSLFGLLEHVDDRAQVWTVTHSAHLISLASLDATLHMSAAHVESGNQVRRALDIAGRSQVLGDLGVDPLELLGSDFLLVVEGEYDKDLLRRLLQTYLSRTSVHLAGSNEGVEAVARALSSGQSPVPWLCIRDRDFMSDDEVASSHSDDRGLFVWPFRSIEGLLLHPPLVAACFSRSGLATTDNQAIHHLKELAAAQHDQIVGDLTRSRLSRLYSVPSTEGSSARERLQRHYTRAAYIAQQRSDNFELTFHEFEHEGFNQLGRDGFYLDGLQARTGRAHRQVAISLQAGADGCLVRGSP